MRGFTNVFNAPSLLPHVISTEIETTEISFHTGRHGSVLCDFCGKIRVIQMSQSSEIQCTTMN